MVKRALPEKPLKNPDDIPPEEKRNHKEFERRTAESRPAVLLVAEWIRKNWGMFVMLPEEYVVKRHRDWPEGSDPGDLFVSWDGEKWWRMEVKHRVKYNFTTLFPFDTIYVCTVHSFDRSKPKPYGFFIVSGDYKSMALLRSETYSKWTKDWVEDPGYEKTKEQLEDPFFERFKHRVQWEYIARRELVHRYFPLT